MKTSAEYQTDLSALESELSRCRLQVADRSRLQQQLIVATSFAVSSSGPSATAALAVAQGKFDAAIEAVSRVSLLEQAVATARDSLAFAAGAERKAICEGIADDYCAQYAAYKVASKALLQQFAELQATSLRYQAMTNRVLMGESETRLHLPALHGANEWSPDIPTGTRDFRAMLK